ncbi:hypothetical protein Salat_0882100 [Sesamum alatum]|uniref:DUF4283 domain-containing protein n=1 Tax=Sesamum alatum TaxID=300844 RepID=A0AAE1YJ63_9LAMI|nr:hypothetical protein Salat_0882100 [Sesamum alatum]
MVGQKVLPFLRVPDVSPAFNHLFSSEVHLAGPTSIPTANISPTTPHLHLIHSILTPFPSIQLQPPTSTHQTTMEDMEPVNSLFDRTLQIDFSDEESDTPNYRNQPTKYPRIAKVICDKPLNNNVIKSTLSKAWRIPPRTHINTIAQNTLVFLLENKDDRHRIWSQSPWSFRGNLVVSKPWLSEEALDEVNLTKFHIWVQATGIPVFLINKKTTEKIGNSIGKFVETDLEIRRTSDATANSPVFETDAQKKKKKKKPPLKITSISVARSNGRLHIAVRCSVPE